jgi:hypothetical protein
MENLNPKIFEDTLQLWRNEVTQKNLPRTYTEIKEYILNDYSAQTTREDRMKIILGVVSKAWTKTSQKEDEDKDKSELTMSGKEKGHKLDTCYNYDKNKSMEENRKIYSKKLEEKKRKLEEKKKRWKEKKAAEANAEKSNTCFEQEAQLYCEP